MKVISPTINREASDKAKGFRLQKLRATKLMLEAIESPEPLFFFAAIEVVEDVSITVCNTECTETHVEEDKNYDSDKNFTIFSDAVRNTLVSFFDIFTNSWRSSNGIILGFYTTAGIGKESKKTLADGTILTLPKTPVLAILRSGVIEDSVAELVKKVMIQEYVRQYGNKQNTGHLETLKNCTTTNFKRFLLSIKWFFSQEDEVLLKATTLGHIRNSKHSNFKVAGKEEIILALILEMLDERQNLASFAARFVTTSDILLIFKQAESEENTSVLDPVWQEIKQLESEIKDKRNLEEKVLAVNPNYPSNKISFLARLACRSKTEQASGNKSFVALKYRIYEACEEYLCNENYSEPVTNGELDLTIQNLQTTAINNIEELKKDYTYTVSNAQVIKGVIMDLVDSCFVSFNKNQSGK